MAKLSGYYDANDRADDRGCLPAGTYTVKVTASEWKKTRAGTGQYLWFEMTVCEGEYENRKIYDRFNLDIPSKEAVKIARSQFAGMREAIGILDPKDSSELMGIRFQVVLKCVPYNGNMSNEVQRYIKRGQTANTPQQQTGTAPYARHSAAPNPETPPPPQTNEGTPPSDDVPF